MSFISLDMNQADDLTKYRLLRMSYTPRIFLYFVTFTDSNPNSQNLEQFFAFKEMVTTWYHGESMGK